MRLDGGLPTDGEALKYTVSAPISEGKPPFSIWLSDKLSRYGKRQELLDQLKSEKIIVGRSTLDSILTGRRNPSEEMRSRIVQQLAFVIADHTDDIDSINKELEAEVAQIQVVTDEIQAEVKQDLDWMPATQQSYPFYLPLPPVYDRFYKSVWDDTSKRFSISEGGGEYRTINFYADVAGAGQDELALHFSRHLANNPEFYKSDSTTRGNVLVVSLANITLLDAHNKEEWEENALRVGRSILRQIQENTIIRFSETMNGIATEILEYLGRKSFILTVVGINSKEAADAFERIAERVLKLDPMKRHTVVSASVAQPIKLEGTESVIKCWALDSETARFVLIDDVFNPETPELKTAVDGLFPNGRPARIDISLPVLYLCRGILWDTSDDQEVEMVAKELSDLAPEGQQISRISLYEFAFDRLPVSLQEILTYCSIFTGPFPLLFLHVVMGGEKTVASLREDLRRLSLQGWILESNTRDEYVMNPSLRDYLHARLLKEQRYKPETNKIIEAQISLLIWLDKCIEEITQTEESLFAETHLSEIQLVLESVSEFLYDILENNSYPPKQKPEKQLTATTRKRIELFVGVVEKLAIIWERKGWYRRGAEELEQALELLERIAPVEEPKCETEEWNEWEKRKRQKVRLTLGRATLLYRCDQLDDTQRELRAISKSIDTYKGSADFEVLLTVGRFYLISGLVEHVKNSNSNALLTLRKAFDVFDEIRRAESKKTDEDASKKAAVYYATWAKIWIGRLYYDRSNTSASLVAFREAYKLAKTWEQPRLLSVVLLSIARTQWSEISVMVEEGSKDAKESAKRLRRTLEYVAPLVAKEGDVSLQAHFDALSGLYYLYRQREKAIKPSGPDNEGRDETQRDLQRTIGDDLMAQGFRAFTKSSDLYWRAQYTSLRSNQEAQKDGRHDVAVDLFLKAVEYWKQLADQDRPTTPPRAALDRLKFVVGHFEDKIRSAGNVRRVLKESKQEIDYVGEFNRWYKKSQNALLESSLHHEVKPRHLTP